MLGPDTTFNGLEDAFVAKVVPSGVGLSYAGYIGGSGNDRGIGIAVDETGATYVAGYTTSDEATFPVLGGPGLTLTGYSNAFAAKITPSGIGLSYAGYIGRDTGSGIAVDSAGAAYVTGFTYSTEATFPVLVGPDTTHNGGIDAFVAKIKALDTDGDGIPDALDECPLLPTPNVITGTPANNILNGTPGNDLIRGLGGNDTIHGLGGNDCLVGGAGFDKLSGMDGNDILSGGDGNDNLRGGLGADTLDGGLGNDQLYGENGNDILTGGDGADKLFGQFGNDTLGGGAGNDLLSGGPGHDALAGENGNDKLLGGPGNDALDGGAGIDSCLGGPGTNTIVNCP